MNNHEWLISKGYKYDEHSNQYYFQLRIFEYGAQVVFTSWEVEYLPFDAIESRHDEFIRRALNREQF